MGVITGKNIIAGSASGVVLAADEPLSFWGGYDWKTGEIIDRRHPLSGQNAAGKILAVPFSRGSSTTTAVLLESFRAGTAPAAIITTQTDFFFALAAVVAEELYERTIPIVSIDSADFAKLESGQFRSVTIDGRILQ